MMKHTYIEDIIKHEGKEVTLKGWLYNRRSSGKVRFLVLRDGTGYCQCVAGAADLPPSQFELCEKITQESSLEVRGTVHKDSRAPGGFELILKEIRLIQMAEEYPIQPKEHGVDFLLDNRHLWIRSSRQHAVLKVRDEVIKAIRDFFYDRHFILVDSPIFTPAACEGTSTLFETDYFGSKAYLTQSGQLYQEPACMALGRTYCFGPTFRAEKSKTRRHLTEFWMIEPEVAFADLDDIMELAEDLVIYIVERVLERKGEELKTLERDTKKLELVKKPFPKISYDEAAQMLKSRGIPFEYGNDFGGTDETILSEGFDRPVMIHHYPAAIKAFYMQPDIQNPDKVLCVDVIAPEGYGEIIGGSQRIHDHDLLLKKIQEYNLPAEAFQWYLDIRKYGSVPHSGFGMGIERVIAWITGVSHLREAIPFPRTLNRIYP
ncbi:MAG: asparagine--tRNA ligase [Acidobacteriota bacterium]